MKHSNFYFLYLLITLVSFSSLGKQPNQSVVQQHMHSRIANAAVHPELTAKLSNENNYSTKAIAKDDNGEFGPEAYDLLPKLKTVELPAPKGADFFGDRIDLNTGALSLHFTDLSVPGNFDIDVAVRRVYRGSYWRSLQTNEFGDWMLDLPSIRTTVINTAGTIKGAWGQGRECSGTLSPGAVMNSGELIEDYQYWNGDSLNIPGKFNEKLLRPNDKLVGTDEVSLVRRVTKSNWKISCFNRYVGGKLVGEGFLAKSPKGYTYRFDNLRLMEARPSGVKQFGPHIKYHAYMRVSKIEDRYGNYVNYAYDETGRLKSISSSDNRNIIFNYDFSGNKYFITSFESNNKIWHYKYSGSGLDINLSEVILPNEDTWTYSLNNLSRFESRNDSVITSNCNNEPVDRVAKGTITSPSGAKATYTVGETYHGLANVKFFQSGHNTKRCFAATSIKRKEIKNSSSELHYVWDYTYSQNEGTYDDGTEPTSSEVLSIEDLPSNLSPSEHKSVTVNFPDNSKEIYIYNRDWTSYLDGTLVAKLTYDVDSITLLKSEEFNYKAGDRVGTVGLPTSKVNSDPHEYRLKLIEKSTKLISNYNETEYATIYSHFNSYDVPERSTHYGPAGKRVYEFSFINLNTSKDWLLSLLKEVKRGDEQGNYQSINNIEYIPLNQVSSSSKATLVPFQQYKFGSLLYEFSEYHEDGNLKKIGFSEGLTNVKESKASGKKVFKELNNYFRGIAQEVKLPNRYLDSEGSEIIVKKSVNSDGKVESESNLNGNVYRYSYDKLNRLVAIKFPTSGSEFYNKFFVWSKDPDLGTTTRTEYRCSLDEFVDSCRTSSKFKEEIVFDGMLRPVKITKEDIPNAKSVHEFIQYDYAGNLTFRSNPEFYDGYSSGTTLVYDGLGRKIRSRKDGFGEVRFEYLEGNRIRKINPKGHYETITYSAFGKPTYHYPIKIESPEDITTLISRNYFDEVTSIRQFGGDGISFEEVRKYDNNHNLCLISRPDVGDTYFLRDIYGKVDKKYQTISNVSKTCLEVFPDTKSIHYEYDNLGGLWKEFYKGKDNENIETTFDRINSGEVKKVLSRHFEKNYAYDVLNNLLSESLLSDGKKYNLLYGYNKNGVINKLSYPDGSIVNRTINQFGQVTKIESEQQIYADNIHYYSSGSLKSFTFGNGVVREYFEDPTNKLIKGILDKDRSTHLFNFQYGYDVSGNLRYLRDNLNEGYSINNITYDANDRLERADGGDFIGSILLDYDSVGNIINYESGSQVLDYHYSATNKLEKVEGLGQKYRTFSYDDRGNVLYNGTRNFVYNLKNQLISSEGTLIRYDENGRRFLQTNGKRSIVSFYNSFGVMLHRDNDNRGISYIYLAGQLIAKNGYIKEDSGNQHYLPFGESLEGAANDNSYTGHQFDSNLGLIYMQARYYDPIIGRFYSNDPVDALGHMQRSNNIAHGFNRYAYANNNPYKYTDPDGEFGIQIAATLIGAVIGGATELITNDNASFSSVARASAVGGAVGLASSLGGGVISSALLGGGANAAGEAANQIATGDFDATKVATAGAAGLVGGALAKGTANAVKGALTKGLPDNSISQASHNTTQSTSQRVLGNSQSLTNAGGKSAVAETQVGAGYAAGSSAGVAAADKVCDQSSGC